MPTFKTASAGDSKFLFRTIIILGILICLVAGWVYWRQVHNSPRRVFEAMLANNLRTRGVSRHSAQESDFQQLDQRVRFQSGQQALVQAETSLSQGAADNPDATVDTESLGTPSEDYVRYTDVKTSQRSQTGAEFDFSKILNIWGITGNDSLTTDGELFGEISLGVIPTGYLQPQDRAELLQLIKQRTVYDTDFSDVKRTIESGRPAYTYEVTVRPEMYLVMLKEFAAMRGLTQLTELDPEDYRDADPLEFELSVDVWSRSLAKIVFKGSGRTETYGSYGARVPVILPNETIPLEELQLRLQSIQ